MIKKIAVIGAGVIGKGVAQNLAAADFQVTLLDLSQEILLDAKSSMRETMRFQGLINPKFKVSNPDKVLSNIIFTTDYTLLEDIDYVIENVIEKWEIKKSVYHKLDQLCRDETVFAVNTSAISITRIASLTKRADKVIGIHFMNPVPMKCLVEVVKGYHTSKKTLQLTTDLLKKWGKRLLFWMIGQDLYLTVYSC
jgi:3-hydroxybutyryl-CoA dehydrogenase